MFGKAVVSDMIAHSAENETDRRVFLKSAGVAGLGTLGAGALAATTMGAADAAAPSDGAILNFALNLEYLEAEFYQQAAFGNTIPRSLTYGKGRRGGVIGGHKVPFKTRRIANYAREIAGDELDHVKFFRGALGSAKVARPPLDLRNSFTGAARAAGLIGPRQQFNPFADENSFLLAAFLFEDVGVTAFKAAAPLISNKTFVEAAAGVLAVEAYHAGLIRSVLYERGQHKAARAISQARDALDGWGARDQGIGTPGSANIVPTDKNGIVFSRPADRVLNIVYLTQYGAGKGGFFPRGVNGEINRSRNNKAARG